MKIIFFVIAVMFFTHSSYAEDSRFNEYLDNLKSSVYIKNLEFKKHNFGENVSRMLHKHDVVTEAFKILHHYYKSKWKIDSAYHLCGCESPFVLTKEEYLDSTLNVLHLIEKKIHYQDNSFLFECNESINYMIDGYQFAASVFLYDHVASEEEDYCKIRGYCMDKNKIK